MLPERVEFIESKQMPGYGHLLPILPNIAIESEIGKKLAEGWNQLNNNKNEVSVQ